MPEQDITYNVRLNEADLLQQLADLRSRINNELSQQSFDMGSTTPAFGNMGAVSAFGSQNAAPFSAPLDFGGDPSNAMTQMLANNAVSPIVSTYNSQVQAMSVGASNFQSDVSVIGSTFGNAGVGVSNTFTQAASKLAAPFGYAPGEAVPSFPNFSDKGWMSNTMSAMGFGYDPKMSLAPGDYRQWAISSLGFQAGEIVGDLTGGAVGSTLGAAIGTAIMPGVGTVVGGFLGGWLGSEAGGAAGNWWTAPATQDAKLARFADYSARFTTLGAGNDPSLGTQVATLTRDFTSSVQGHLEGIDRKGAEAMLMQFSDAGGFSTARTSDEYVQRFDDMLEGNRKVMHALRTTSEKATQFMAEMENLGMIGGGIGQFSNYTSAGQGISAFGGMMNMTGASAAQIGAGAVQAGMQQLGFWGVSPESQFWGGLQTEMSVRQGLMGGVYDLSLARQFGGPEGMTQSIIGGANQFATSDMGFITSLARRRTGSIGGASFGDMVSAGLSEFASEGIRGIMLNRGTRRAIDIENSGPEQFMFDQTAEALSEIEMLGLGPVTEDVFESYMMTSQHMSRPEARLRWSTMAGAGKRPSVANQTNAYANSLLRQQASEVYSDVSTVGAVLGHTWDTMWDTVRVPASLFYRGMGSAVTNLLAPSAIRATRTVSELETLENLSPDIKNLKSDETTNDILSDARNSLNAEFYSSSPKVLYNFLSAMGNAGTTEEAARYIFQQSSTEQGRRGLEKSLSMLNLSDKQTNVIHGLADPTSALNKGYWGAEYRDLKNFFYKDPRGMYESLNSWASGEGTFDTLSKAAINNAARKNTLGLGLDLSGYSTMDAGMNGLLEQARDPNDPVSQAAAVAELRNRLSAGTNVNFTNNGVEVSGSALASMLDTKLYRDSDSGMLQQSDVLRVAVEKSKLGMKDAAIRSVESNIQDAAQRFGKEANLDEGYVALYSRVVANTGNSSTAKDTRADVGSMLAADQAYRANNDAAGQRSLQIGLLGKQSILQTQMVGLLQLIAQDADKTGYKKWISSS